MSMTYRTIYFGMVGTEMTKEEQEQMATMLSDNGKYETIYDNGEIIPYLLLADSLKNNEKDGE
jgi:hypothetical protein